MTTTYMVFLKNSVSGAEFVAPTNASSREEAQIQAGGRYAAPLYHIQTCYSLAEMKRIMADVERWPGVASQVQPPLENMLKNVRSATGKLPPLRKEEAPAAPSTLADAVRRSQEATGTKVSAWGAKVEAVPQAATPKAPATLAEAMEAIRNRSSARPAAPTPVGGKQPSSTLSATKTAAPRSTGKKATSSTLQAASLPQGRSVIDVLRALRG